MKQKIGILITLLFLVWHSGLAQTNGSTTAQKKDPTYIPIVDQLQHGEQFTIAISSNGCFHQSREVMTISMNKSEYFAILGDTKKILNKEHIKALRRFEKELQSAKGGGCTTLDQYTLTYGNLVAKHTDGSCAWNGGRKLKEHLFPEL